MDERTSVFMGCESIISTSTFVVGVPFCMGAGVDMDVSSGSVIGGAEMGDGSVIVCSMRDNWDC